MNETTFTRQPGGSVLVESVVMGRAPSSAERATLNEAVEKMTDILNSIPPDMWPSLIASMFTTVAMTYDDPALVGAMLIETCGLSLSSALRASAGNA
jgi:hypothetical protein